MGFLGFKEIAPMLGQGDPPKYFRSPSYNSAGDTWAVGKVMTSRHAPVLPSGMFQKKNPTTQYIHCDLCGFHSWKRPEFMQSYNPLTNWYAVVDNFGEVVEHEFGYRAQKSKLIFVAKTRQELIEWAEEPLGAVVDPQFLAWVEDDTKDTWVVDQRDTHATLSNYLRIWLGTHSKAEKLRLDDGSAPFNVREEIRPDGTIIRIPEISLQYGYNYGPMPKWGRRVKHVDDPFNL